MMVSLGNPRTMEEIAAACLDELAACNAHAACPDELAVALASSPQDDATAEHDAVISCIGNSEFSPPSGPIETITQGRISVLG